MKRITFTCSILLVIGVLLAPLVAFANASATPPVVAATSAPSDHSPVSAISSTIATITGIAITPLLGTGFYGAYKYYAAKDSDVRATLPWYAQPSFFVPALLIALVCALKDSLGAVLPPGWKKPLDVLETVENKASGLVAAGAVVPFTVDSLRGLIGGGTSAAASGVSDGVHTTGLAMLHFASIDFSWLLNLLTVPLGIAVFAAVWMTSHAINVLILLSPWGAIDAALKSVRTAILGVLTLTATLDPKIAAIFSIIIIIASYFLAGWSFRLMIFGTSFCWDMFTFRKYRLKVDTHVNKLFSGGRLPKVPTRSYGKLVNEPEHNRMRFTYKPWLVLPERSVEVAMSDAHVGKGFFFSSIRDGENTYFLLPPRYRGHEEEIVAAYGFKGVREAGILKGWRSMRELFGGSATKTQVV